MTRSQVGIRFEDVEFTYLSRPDKKAGLQYVHSVCVCVFLQGMFFWEWLTPFAHNRGCNPKRKLGALLLLLPYR